MEMEMEMEKESGAAADGDCDGGSRAKEEEEIENPPTTRRRNKRKRRKSSFTFTHKKRGAKKKKKKKPLTAMERYEDRVLRGEFSVTDVRKAKIEPREYTDPPIPQQEIDFYNSDEGRALLANLKIKPRGDASCKRLHFISRSEMKTYDKAVYRSEVTYCLLLLLHLSVYLSVCANS